MTWERFKERAQEVEDQVTDLPAIIGVPIVLGVCLVGVAVLIFLISLFVDGPSGRYVCGYNDGPKGAKTPVYCDYPVVEDVHG